MKLIAGNHEIRIDTIYATRVMAEGQMRDGRRLVLSEGLTKEQLSALSENNWCVMNDDILVENLEGYNTPVQHEIVFAKILTKQQEVNEILQPILDALSDDKALEFTKLYPEWESGKSYIANARVRYNGVLFKCITEHISQDNWTPELSASLWATVLTADSEDTVNIWVQPDSTNPYTIGDKVTHNDKVWKSIVNDNVWEPGVYGWEEVIEESEEESNG